MLLNVPILISNRDFRASSLNFFIVALDVANFLGSQQLISPLHFIDRPFQGRDSLFWLSNHWS